MHLKNAGQSVKATEESGVVYSGGSRWVTRCGAHGPAAMDSFQIVRRSVELQFLRVEA